MADINVYLPDGLAARYKVASAVGLIERGFASRAVREAIESELTRIGNLRSALAAYGRQADENQ